MKIFRKRFISLFLAGLVLMISCEQYNGETTVEELSYSGEELYKSFIFLNGDATEGFPILRERYDIDKFLDNKIRVAEYEKFQNEAVNYIKNKNKGFFPSFKESMYSQNPLVIKEALADAFSVLEPFLKTKMKESGINYEISVDNRTRDELMTELNQRFLEQQTQKNTFDSELAVNIAVAINVAVVIFVVVDIAVAITAEFGYHEQDNSKFYSEELSRKIATKLISSD